MCWQVVPVAPSAIRTSPRSSRSRKAIRVAWLACGSPFARHPARDWHLAVRQVAEASTGRDPQPLSMSDELTLATHPRISAAKAGDARKMLRAQLVVEHALALAAGQAEHAALAEMRVVVHVVAGLSRLRQR